MENFSISGLLLLAVGLYLSFCGIATIVTRKVYGYGKEVQKYTVESVRKSAPLMGLGTLVCGLAMIAAHLGDVFLNLTVLKDNSLYILIGGVVVGAVIMFFGTKGWVKKEDK